MLNVAMQLCSMFTVVSCIFYQVKYPSRQLVKSASETNRCTAKNTRMTENIFRLCECSCITFVIGTQAIYSKCVHVHMINRFLQCDYTQHLTQTATKTDKKYRIKFTDQRQLLLLLTFAHQSYQFPCPQFPNFFSFLITSSFCYILIKSKNEVQE